jgi:hypothetical protein
MQDERKAGKKSYFMKAIAEALVSHISFKAMKIFGAGIEQVSQVSVRTEMKSTIAYIFVINIGRARLGDSPGCYPYTLKV